SNSIAFFERYSICGDGTQWAGDRYVEHIWGEDGCCLPGPLSEHFQDGDSMFSPAYWIELGSGGNTPDPRQIPDYPINRTTGKPYPTFTGIQVAPTVKSCNPHRLHAFTVAGMQVAMMDGSARIVNPGVSLTTLARAIVPNDGFPLGSDW